MHNVTQSIVVPIARECGPDDGLKQSALVSAGSGPVGDGQVAMQQRFVICGVLWLALLGSLTVFATYDASGRQPVVPAYGGNAHAQIVVDNRVVVDAVGLVPDVGPAYLSVRPVPRCVVQVPTCKITGSDFVDGQAVDAVCFVFGEGMTNMDFGSLTARLNPARVTSSLWYGVRDRQGRVGYISEVYLTPESRGGLGLARCP